MFLQIFSLIFNFFKSSLENIWSAIVAIPDAILSGFQSLFVPDSEVLKQELLDFFDLISGKFGFDTAFMDYLVSYGRPPSDISEFYEVPFVGTFNFTFLDVQYLISGVEYFRPYIRGFWALLLGFYNIKMALSFFNQDAGVVSGRLVSMFSRKGDD